VLVRPSIYNNHIDIKEGLMIVSVQL
jgi:hypothetical protein